MATAHFALNTLFANPLCSFWYIRADYGPIEHSYGRQAKMLNGGGWILQSFPGSHHEARDCDPVPPFTKERLVAREPGIWRCTTRRRKLGLSNNVLNLDEIHMPVPTQYVHPAKVPARYIVNIVPLR